MANDPPRESDGNTRKHKRTRSDVIEISSDEDDDPRKLADQHRSKIASRNSSSIPSAPSSSKAQSVLQNKSERYKLEYERLARQRARELASNPSGPSSPASPAITPSIQPPTEPSVSQSETFQYYWNSTIKVTFNDWYPDCPNALRIEDIIGPKDRIKMVLVSSYVLELPWIHKLFNPRTRIMVIRHHTDCGSFKVNERANMFLCHPPMLKTANGNARPGCMHIKFFIIFYDTFCRVAIPTANAVSFDYEIVENAVWIQDFRRFDGNTIGYNSRRPDEVPPFRKTLDDLLDRMGVPLPFRKPLEDHDFRTAAANLVVSVQGDHSANSPPFGQMRLAKELKTLGLQSGPGTGRTASLECQGSSIGSYDLKWLNNFYRCASGSLPTAGLPEPDLQTDSSTSPFSVLYPSLHTVRNSKSGKAGAGTLFCNKATWEKANFPKHIFADTMSKRAGVLMHVKMILGLFTSDSSSESTSSTVNTSTGKPDRGDEQINKDHIGFLYIGSHNFTPAAWGKFTSKKTGSRESTLLEISNWELGVVLPVKSHAQIEEYVTWQRPPKPYGHRGKDSSIPWMQFSHGR
ncbi:hypothetical protein PTTG_01497 [Puccinia triticina 1-1 BBBD Race 1]|uniref:PLD phosphodiesterase domain-containing protein n=1 Tax=Puccinia triticina (isolate 1-1 / race 1 (BBBD)) TaxID=630390 RepID=A0A180G6D5_PUCT1|nr:hypothetical protein PTTG_01497 [Puccinia triticina 1-1 BBBD Race 1]WAR58664.1 hypothetical protein PtB15_10B2 [Puccinia triticina]